MFKKFMFGLMFGIVCVATLQAQVPQGTKIQAYACGEFDIRDETEGRQWGFYSKVSPSKERGCYEEKYIKAQWGLDTVQAVGKVRYCYGMDGRMKMVITFREGFRYQETNVYVGVGTPDGFQPSIYENQFPVEEGPDYVVYDINEIDAIGKDVYMIVHAVGTIRR